ncbi:MAG TPA: Holliday junction branch migration protein RuvA [Paracoccaceae bacterium]|nr:Holliday junction branch migration protein RuvA [Paracoccaceae bacterium]
MIGRLAGGLEHPGTDPGLIDVRGVGYVVHVSDRTLAGLPRIGEAVALWTDLLVREDLLQLFGFATLQEKEWHRALMTVQGVGAKAAMAILGALGAEGVGRAVALGDARAIQAAPGIGPKIASRVVLELKARAPALMAMGQGVVGAPDAVIEAEPPPVRAPRRAATPAAPPPSAIATADALSALANLGYAPPDAAAAVAEAGAEMPGADTAALIRAALKRLAPRG